MNIIYACKNKQINKKKIGKQIMNVFATHHPNKFQHSNVDIKLPKIDALNPKAMRLQLKSTTKLPNLKIDGSTSSNQNGKIKETVKQPHTDLLIQSTKIRQRQKSEGDDFVTEVQKKLKIVLQQQNIIDIEESNGSDEDFEQKINKNKEIIKMRKMKRQNQLQAQPPAQPQLQRQLQLDVPNLTRKKKQSLNQNKKSLILQKQKSKNQSLYEKRIKDYREMSHENKFLLKKKENMQKQTLFSSKKEKEQTIANTNDTNSNQNPNFKSNKPNPKKIVENQRPSTKLISSANVSLLKDEELFDNIHNILMNPSQKRENPEKAKEAKQKKQLLQERIKQLQVKICEQKDEDIELLEKIRAQSNTQFSNLDHEHNECVSNDDLSWRRVEVTNLNLKSGKTNFDHQIERVNHYFERNEKCIESYVENQKRLMDMSLLKKAIDEGPQLTH